MTKGGFTFFIIVSFFCIPVHAQQLTTPELIGAWKTGGISQTTRAETTYADLKVHINAHAYQQRIKELDAYLSNNPDGRLEVRTTMYRILGLKELERPLTSANIRELKHAITLAGLLSDEQLLSEIYSLYGEIQEQPKRLFYDLKAEEIQNHIGAAHFPMLWMRYLTISECLYRTMEYRQCIHYGMACLKLMGSPARGATDYILQSDAIGASYLQLGITDSAMIYYQKISGVLAAYPSLNENYKKIWTGIVAGETGQALFLKKKYTEASPLLAENVRSSYALGQLSDAAHAQNTLARIGFIEKKYDSALTGWRRAWQWSLKSGDLESAVSAVSGIMEVYRSIGRYDSAFRYNDLFHTYRDSLIEKINNGRLATVTARIDDDNMQASLLAAQKVISGQRRIRNIILAGILIATVLALTFYSRYNQKQNYRRELLERRNQLTAMEIAHAREQIADFTRNISTKNRLIENMQAKLDQEITAEAATTLRHFTILTDEDWQNFKDAFGKLHPGFWNTLDEKFPDLTLAEKRFMALSRLGLNNKEMASSMGVSPQTIRVLTYRLRKKMDIPETAGLRAIAQNI